MGVKQVDLEHKKNTTFVGARRILAKIERRRVDIPKRVASVLRYVLAANAVYWPSLGNFRRSLVLSPSQTNPAIDTCKQNKRNRRGLVGRCAQGRDRLGAHGANPAHSAGLGRRLPSLRLIILVQLFGSTFFRSFLTFRIRNSFY